MGASGFPRRQSWLYVVLRNGVPTGCKFMTETKMEAVYPVSKRPATAVRILSFLFVAWLAGWSLDHFGTQIYDAGQPAGFTRGILHGALMPLAMPNLIVGQDPTIYSPSNTGRPYKLGYTLGVNACGLLFFGVVFWRVGRWGRRRRAVAAGH